MGDGPGSPPSSFDFEPEFSELKAGVRLFRIDREKKYAGKFNPRKDLNYRFSPIFDGKQLIPTFYCAQTVEAAIFESILRDKPTLKDRVVPHTSFKNQYVSEIEVKRDLKVISLRGRGLKRLGLMEAELIHGGPNTYEDTRPWAEALYRECKTAKGLIWTSRQLGPKYSAMLFGTRFKTGDFQLVKTPEILERKIDIFKFANDYGFIINT